MPHFYLRELLNMGCTTGFQTNTKLTLRDFAVCDTSRAESSVLLSIRAAAQGIWDGTSVYLALVPELHDETRATFDSRATYEQFHLNWVNVETGGNFNLGHTNVSHQHDGTPEKNYGMYQVNERWALDFNVKDWGRIVNPWKFRPKDMLENVVANATLGFNHLLGMTRSEEYRKDFWSALDLYWHGRCDNNAYSQGVRRGVIIPYSE